MSNQRLAKIQPLLDELHAEAEAIDGPVLATALQAAADRGATKEADVADLLSEAYIPIDPENGRLVHTLASARRPGRIVEFGTSMGLSAIYLAAALGEDELPMVTTELDLIKVGKATTNIDKAGLGLRVDLRAGDAFETLADFSDPISLLFLDGWKDLYLPMLKLLEPLLVDGAFVIADDTILFADQCEPLLAYLRDPASGYSSAPLLFGDGMEIACRVKN